MELKEWLSGNVLVVAHVGDIDACSSFVAFEQLAKKLNPKAKLEFCISGALNNDGKKIFNLFGFEAKLLKEIEPESFQKILLLDTQPNLLPETLREKDIFIIDHHQPSPAVDTVSNKIIREAVSTTEILYYIYTKYKIEISEKSARAIIYGIISDTGGLRFAKSSALKVLAELLEEHKLEYQDLLASIAGRIEEQEKLAWLKACQRLEIKIIDGKIIAISNVGAYESSAAQKILSLGADVALVVSRKPKQTRIAGRARGFDLAKIFINASDLFGGTGGGHPSAAVLNIPADKEKEALNYILKELKNG